MTCVHVLFLRSPFTTFSTSSSWIPKIDASDLPESQQQLCLINHILCRSDSRAGVAIVACIGLSIMLSVISLSFGTLPKYRAPGSSEPARFFVIDAICVAFFATDYFLRLFTCLAVPWTDEAGGFHRLSKDAKGGTLSVKGQFVNVARKLAFFLLTPLNIVDALSIFPSMSFFVNRDSPHISILRILRLGRVIRIWTQDDNSTASLLGRSLWRSAGTLLFMLFLLGMSIIFFASAVFYCEKVRFHRLSVAEFRMLSQLLNTHPSFRVTGMISCSCLCARGRTQRRRTDPFPIRCGSRCVNPEHLAASGHER